MSLVFSDLRVYLPYYVRIAPSAVAGAAVAAAFLSRQRCLILTQKLCRKKISFRTSHKRLFPHSLSKLPLKQLTDSANMTFSGKEFHKFTTLFLYVGLGLINKAIIKLKVCITH